MSLPRVLFRFVDMIGIHSLAELRGRQLPAASYGLWLPPFVLLSRLALAFSVALHVQVLLWGWLFDLFSHENWLSMHLIERIIIDNDSSDWNQRPTLRSWIEHRLSRVASSKRPPALRRRARREHWLDVAEHRVAHTPRLGLIPRRLQAHMPLERSWLWCLSVDVGGCHCDWDLIRTQLLAVPDSQHNLVRDAEDALVAGSQSQWLATLCHSRSPCLSLRPLVGRVLLSGGLGND